jgi:exo-beta-1,3-glucanase (GH17 family)
MFAHFKGCRLFAALMAGAIVLSHLVAPSNAAPAMHVDGGAAPRLAPVAFLPLVAAPVQKKIALNFSPYVDGQVPSAALTLSEAQIRERLGLVAEHATWVRSFSCGNGLEKIGSVAHELGLKSAVTAWIMTDTLANQQQITCLIGQINAGNVDLAIVGSEALLRNDVSQTVLIDYIDQVRSGMLVTVPVTTADVYGTFINNPELQAKVDVVFANIYPFWEGDVVNHGVSVVNFIYNQLVENNPDKRVYISETGWPSCGAHGAAVGSVANEALYFNQMISWARDRAVTLFWFDALDEQWKASVEGPQGACWGAWDRAGQLKAGMSPALDGAHTPYTTSAALSCGTDAFSFEFTSVPPIGSYENVAGRACGVLGRRVKVVLYIYVGGNWWVKPYANAPKSPVNADGTWSIDYTTGGIDQQATILRAYLVPNEAGTSLAEVASYPMISVTRSP